MIEVYFRSSYGTSAQYARWLAEDLGAEAHPVPSVAPRTLVRDSEGAVLFTPIYAGSFQGKRLAEVFVKRGVPLALAVIGATPPDSDDRKDAVNASIPEEFRGDIPVFHLPGEIKWDELKFIHRMLMRFVTKAGGANKVEISYREPVDNVDRAALEPVLAWAQSQTMR